MLQREGLAVCGLEVRENVPREAAGENRGRAQRKLQSLIPRLGAVQVEQDVTCGVAATDVVDDLVLGLLTIERRVKSKPVVQEAELGSDFVRACEFRLETEVRPGESVSITTVCRGLELERRLECIRPRVLSDFCVSGAQLSGHVSSNCRECVREHEARRDRRIEER